MLTDTQYLSAHLLLRGEPHHDAVLVEGYSRLLTHLARLQQLPSIRSGPDDLKFWFQQLPERVRDHPVVMASNTRAFVKPPPTVDDQK